MAIKKRTAIFIIFCFALFVLLIIPMRSAVTMLDSSFHLKTKSVSGFWWNGNLEQVTLNSRVVGDIELQFNPVSLIGGKAGFNITIKGPEITLNGMLGVTLKGNLFLENTNFTLNPQIKTHSQQSFFQNISTVKASITYLYFNTDRCLKAEGHGTGELIDLFGMFPQLIGISLDLTCKENLFEISIKSTLEDVLEGEMLIKTNSEYSLEVKSKRLSNKILEISKLKFKKGPSFKISGRLDELMNVN